MPYDTLIQCAHVARNILITLSGRPISVSNTAYVVSSLRSLQAIVSAIEGISCEINPYYRDDCRRFAQLLKETVRQPTAPRLAAMRHYIENDLPLYSRLATQAPVSILSYPHGFDYQDMVYERIVADVEAGR